MRIFTKLIAITSVASLILSEASWASAVAGKHVRSPAAVISTRPLTEALIPTQAAAFYRNRLLENSKTLLLKGSIAAIALALTVLGQPPVQAAEQKPKPAPKPQVTHPTVPAQDTAESMNKQLTDESWKGAWHLDEVHAQPGILKDQLAIVLNESPVVAATFYEHREALQQLVAAISNEGKYATLRSDQVKALGFPSIGSYDTISQVLTFPGISVSDPKSTIQVNDPSPVTKPEGKGFLYWRVLTRVVTRAVEGVLTGVQFYSKNQVEASFLKEHQRAFDARRAYTRLEQSAQEQHLLAMKAWVAYATQETKVGETREATKIAARIYEREKRAAALEGKGAATLLRLKQAHQDASDTQQTAEDSLEPYRLAWLRTIAGSESKLVASLGDSAKPQTPEWKLGDTLPTPANHEPEFEDVFRLSDSDKTLGTSPLERELQLQREALSWIDIPLLELQKQRTYRVGLHFDLGSAPFFASLLDFDLKNPSQSTKLSLDQLMVAVRLKMAAIDEKIQAEQLRVRAEYEAVRARRAQALSQLARIRRQYEAFVAEESLAKRAPAIIPADQETPSLEQARLKARYARYLTEVWVAAQEMRLYTIDGQRELLEQVEQHQAKVLERLQMKTEKPVAYRTIGNIRWVLPSALAIIATLFPGFTTAHTFKAAVSPVATEIITQAVTSTPVQAVQQMALEVTLGAYRHGSAANTLWGIAKDILHATGQSSSGQAIRHLAEQIATNNHLASASKVQKGATLHLGTYPADVVEKLTGAIPSANVIPAPPVHAPAAAPVVHAPVAPTPAPAPVVEVPASAAPVDTVHSSFTDTLSSWGVTMLHWLQDPTHLALLAGGIIAAVAFTSWMRTRVRFSNPYPSFTEQKSSLRLFLEDHSLRAPLFMFTGIYAISNFSWISSTLTFYAWLPWLKPIAAMILGGFAVGRRPGLRQIGVVRWGSPMLVASLVTWLAPVSALSGTVAVFAVSWFVFQWMLLAPSTATLNGFYRLIRSRSAPFIALLSMLVFFPAFQQNVATPLSQWTTSRINTLSNANTLGTNFGVSVRPVSVPVTWAPPESATVTQARWNRQRVAAGQWVAVYEPLEAPLRRRLDILNHTLSTLLKNAPIDVSRLASAADEHPDAIIRLRADFAASVDQEISDTLDSAEKVLRQLEMESAKSRQLAEASGDAVANSLLEEELRAELAALGSRLNARLLERDARNLAAERAFQIYPGTTQLAEGSELRRGSPVELFRRELTDHRLLQLRLTPEDAVALSQEWQTHAAQSTIRLVAQNQKTISLPLAAISEFIRDDSSAWDTRQENFSSQQIINPALGADKMITVNLAVRADADKTWSSSVGPFEFAGIFSGEQRVLGSTHGLWIGSLSLLSDNTTHLPHFRYRLSALGEDLTSLQRYRAALSAMTQRVQAHQAEFRERGWASDALLELQTRERQIESQEARVAADIRLIETSGQTLSPRTQPVEPLIFNNYPLRRDHAAGTAQESLQTVGSRVTLRVTFYEPTPSLQSGDQVRVRSALGQSRFRIVGETSLDARYELYRYYAEAQLSWEEAKRLFPSSRALTQSVVLVEHEKASSPASTPESTTAPVPPVKQGSLFGLLPGLLASLLGIKRRPVRQEENLNLETFDFPLRQSMPRHPKPVNAEVAAPAQTPQARKLATSQLELFRTSLKTTVLEEERYWYHGDPTTSLTWIQWLTHSFRAKIKLSERKILLRRYQRDGMGWWTSTLLNMNHYIETGRESAGSKTTTILWVWPLIGGVISAYLFGSTDLVLDITKFFTTNPMVLGLAGHRATSMAVSVFIGFLVVGLTVTAGKGFGELMATGPYNAVYLFLAVVRGIFRYDVNEQHIREKTRLDRIYTEHILTRGSQEYEHFMEEFHAFTLQIARRAHDKLSRDTFDAPSEEAIAFDNAFRIQIRRSQNHHSPVYPGGVPLEPRPKRWHLEMLKRRGYPVTEDLETQDRFLEFARIQESKDLMLQYPEHTLMALFRAGTTELTAEIRQMKDQALVREILSEIKDRTHTLDDDVFDAVRSQERFEDLFELLHYAFEGLKDATLGLAPEAVKRNIKDFWNPIVSRDERTLWEQFWRELPTLLDDTGKTTDQVKSDENIVRMIAYALTLRIMKEDEPAARKFLDDQRRRKPHNPEFTMGDRYLRGPDGLPTTSVLQLNTAYVKYFDLMTEIAGRFPDEAILGDRDIFLTAENIPNFRQGIRELSLWSRLTRGQITLIDVGNTNGRFIHRIDDNIPTRLPAKFAGRVNVSTLEKARGKLARDTRAVTVSSATPLDWLILVQASGERYHVPSELLSPAAAVMVIRDLAKDRLNWLGEITDKRLKQRYLQLEQMRRPLQAQLETGWPEYDAAGWRFLDVFRMEPSLAGLIREAKSYIPYQWHGRQMNQLRLRYERIEQEQDQLLRRMDELTDLRHEIASAGHFLKRMNIHTEEFRDQTAELPVVAAKDTLKGNWVVNVLFRLHAAQSAERHISPRARRLLASA